MRIAALAFGVLAGLVASLILALGGLDPSALPQLDPRQMSLISFGLFIVANLGVLGAGIVLAAPLAGVILLLLGAVGWIAAALALHHGPDMVMLTPPGLLLVAAILAVVAVVRRPRAVAATVAEAHAEHDDLAFEQEREAALAALPLDLQVDEHPEAQADENHDEPNEDEPQPSGVAVGATFFGDAGTATPLRGAMPPRVEEQQPALRATAEDPATSLGPIRRRSDPPRQKSVFVEPDDEDEDEESGFSRFARALSGILSFGLYAALAGAAVLVFLNLRTGEVKRPSATRIEASTAAKAPLLSSSASSAAPPSQLAEAPAVSALPPLLTPPAAPMLAGEPEPSSTFGAASSALERELSNQLAAPPLDAVAQTASSVQLTDPFVTPSSPVASSAEPAIAASPADATSPSAPQPLAMPPQMAAARARPAPRVTAPAPAATGDTGL